ncbi:MAG: MBL fold metallo-hydrolase [Desulfomonilia bacterium]
MVGVRWLGTAGIELHYGDNVILIDPYLTRPRKLEVLLRPLKPNERAIVDYCSNISGNVRALIIGHTHFDHALDAPVCARTLQCPVFGSRSLKTLCAFTGDDSRVTVCTGRENIDLFDGSRLVMIPSNHGLVFFGRVPYPGEIDPGSSVPLRAHQYRLGDMFMPLIELGGTTFIHAGSANFIESQIESVQCDILFMCVPGWKKNPSYTKEFVSHVRPSVIIPFHYDDFTTPLDRFSVLPCIDVKGFENSVRSTLPGVEILHVRPGIEMHL